MNTTQLTFRPIKPATIESESDLAKLSYPIYGFYKYDGIRCGVFGGRCLSNTLKPIPNRYINECLAGLSKYAYYWDGELILNGTKDFHKVQSAVMTRKGEPDFSFMCFDRILEATDFTGMNYGNRLGWLQSFNRMPTRLDFPKLRYIHPVLLFNVEAVLLFEADAIKQGYEGIILRHAQGMYKFGTCTWNDMNLFKFKRTEDAEGEILDCNELMHNGNDSEVDVRGLTKRSSHGENKYGSGMLGSFKVRGINGKYKDKVFDVSCGSMTHEERRGWWIKKTTFKAFKHIITYKFDKHRGTDDAPAGSRFKAFRDERDL